MGCHVTMGSSGAVWSRAEMRAGPPPMGDGRETGDTGLTQGVTSRHTRPDTTGALPSNYSFKSTNYLSKLELSFGHIGYRDPGSF